MKIPSGLRLGSFEIDDPLGAGGMGEVYRARDTRLDRPVAIKFLSAAIADAEASRRFGQEAKTASSLNHPHIVTVFETGEWDGRQYLVTEFIDGGTLREWARTASGSWRRIVELLVGVADGVACAHDAGILHRDIKPENILVTKNGYAKLADFGLAKLTEHRTPTTETRTFAGPGTRPGMIVGTIAYMSPEQAAGRTVDARSDVFSFGVVLYELLAKRHPFEGASDLEVLQSVIHRPARPLAEQRPDLPAMLTMAVDKALEKDPADRYQSMRDLVVDLRRLLRQSTEQSAAVPMARRRRSIRVPVVAALAAIVLALGVAAGWKFLVSAKRTTSSSSEYTQITDFVDSATAPALSPDGRMVAFIRGGAPFLSRGQIYVKVLPDGDSVRLTNESGPLKYAPVFTPDGSRVAYTRVDPSGWDTWTVPILGGEPTRLLPNASALTWIDRERVLFSEVKSGLHMGIVTSTESRTDSREIYFPEHERAMAHFSYASPDRRWVLVIGMDRTGAWEPCRLVPFDGRSAGRLVGPQGRCTSAAWSPDGKWMYFGADMGGSSHLWRQWFPDGAPEQITFGPTEEEGIAMAPDGGSLITSVGVRQNAIWMHDASGDRLISAEGSASFPRVSADFKRVYYLRRQQNTMLASNELYVVELASGKTDRVLPGLRVEDFDISRDEKEVVFVTSQPNGESRISLASLDRRSPPREIARAADGPLFGADGHLVFRLVEQKANFLYRMNKDGSGRQRLMEAPIVDVISVSPDGEWLVVFVPGFAADSSPATIAFPFRGGESRKICSALCFARWSSDGRFFYVAGEAATSATKTFVIPVAAGRALPDLPVAGLDPNTDLAAIVPGTRTIEQGYVIPGPDPSTYVFAKTDLRRNLFRINLQ